MENYAIDYLYSEWTYKPVAFVSYGGIAGGTRAVQMLKQVVTYLKMMPVTEAVSIPFFNNYIRNEVFVSDEILDKSAHAMIQELIKWTGVMKGLRTQNILQAV